MKNLRSLILLLSLCIATPAQPRTTVIVEECSSFWNWPWDAPSYRTYTVCNSCCHSRCCCYDYDVLSTKEGLIATLIVSAVALAVKLIQESGHKERRTHRQKRTTEVVHIRSY